MQDNQGVSASPPGLRPFGVEPPSASQAEPLVPNAVACFDCGLPYGGESWIEAVVPHDIWNNHLSPTGNEGGILCINCMASRASNAGLRGVPLTIHAGPCFEIVHG